MKLQQSFDSLYKLDFYEHSELLKLVKDELKTDINTNETYQVDIKPKSGNGQFVPLSDLYVE